MSHSPCSIFYYISGTLCGIWGNRGKKMSNFNFFTIFLISVVFGLVIAFLPSVNPLIDTNLDRIFGRHGIEIVYRLSCAMAVSHAVLFLLTLCWPFLHHMFLLVFILLIIGFAYLFIWEIKSTTFISGFRTTARVISFFYLVLQAMSLVDLAFTFHEWIIFKIEESNKTNKNTDKACCMNQYYFLYITLCTVFIGLAISSCIAFFFIFRVNKTVCWVNVLNIGVTLIMGFICCIISVSERVNRGLLPASVFFLIIVFYLILSLLANSNSICNPYQTHSRTWIIIIDVCMVATSGFWISYRMKSENVNNDVVNDMEKGNEKHKIKIPEENGFEPAIFHFCMILASFYLAMLCSAWYAGDYSIRPNSFTNYTSTCTLWVFICSIWTTFLVYIYVLVIPLLNSSKYY